MSAPLPRRTRAPRDTMALREWIALSGRAVLIVVSALAGFALLGLIRP
ncbi:MAG: hypothetical protein JNK67_14470 [Alphaproteobacteria bacterium]|nr:hypothetical protein [Alphaproteobacteria bacterium]